MSNPYRGHALWWTNFIYWLHERGRMKPQQEIEARLKEAEKAYLVSSGQPAILAVTDEASRRFGFYQALLWVLSESERKGWAAQMDAVTDFQKKFKGDAP